jgi:hypothetical protein
VDVYKNEDGVDIQEPTTPNKDGMDINKVPHRQTYIELSALKRE